MQRFFEDESLGVSTTEENPIGVEERWALAMLEETTLFFLGDRYEAGLLRRDDDPCIPHNRAMALRGFNSLWQALPGSHSGVITLCHPRTLTRVEAANWPAGRTWWLPHHAVINPNKLEEVRVVFDATARYGNVS